MKLLSKLTAYLVAFALSLGLSTSAPLFPDSPGMVSYTFREDLAKDLPGTLDRIKALGVTDMEFSDLFGKKPEELRAMLDERGMICSSYGTSMDALQKTPDETAALAKTLGAKYIRVAWLPGRQPFTLELAENTAKDFNTIGKHLREKHDLVFCYHNHGYEFVPHGNGTLFDVLLDKTRPEDVSFELDILWAFFPGADPAALLKKYGDRFKLLHLKDLKQGVEGNLSGTTHRDNDVTLGTGQLDLPTILRAAKLAGVTHYYIEDESTRVWEQVPDSIRFFKELDE